MTKGQVVSVGPVLSIGSAPSWTPCSHQRSWSADLCRSGMSPHILVKKPAKEPPPPQRSASLLRPNSLLLFNRYSSSSRIHSSSSSSSSLSSSSSPIRVNSSSSSSSSIRVNSSSSSSSSSIRVNSSSSSSSPIRVNSSSSSSSSIRVNSSSSSSSSCSSPPPVKTSDITGHDPLGWRLGPKSRFSTPASRRLSLQIPLPVVFPVVNPVPAANSSPTPQQPEPAVKTKPALEPKPSRRHHSESSAFLKSLVKPPPGVMLKELQSVKLRPTRHTEESDDVFSENDEEATAWPHKVPPPVPEKTALARQIAQLIACSRQNRRLIPAQSHKEEKHIYSSVIKPKHSQLIGRCSLRAKKHR